MHLSAECCAGIRHLTSLQSTCPCVILPASAFIPLEVPSFLRVSSICGWTSPSCYSLLLPNHALNPTQDKLCQCLHSSLNSFGPQSRKESRHKESCPMSECVTLPGRLIQVVNKILTLATDWPQHLTRHMNLDTSGRLTALYFAHCCICYILYRGRIYSYDIKVVVHLNVLMTQGWCWENSQVDRPYKSIDLVIFPFVAFLWPKKWHCYLRLQLAIIFFRKRT